MPENILSIIGFSSSLVMLATIFIRYFKEKPLTMPHALVTAAAVVFAALSLGYDIEIREGPDGIGIDIRKQLEEVKKKADLSQEIAFAAKESATIAQEQVILARDETLKAKEGLISIMSAVNTAESVSGQKTSRIAYIDPEKWKSIQNKLVNSGVIKASDLPKTTSLEAFIANDPFAVAQREALLKDKRLIEVKPKVNDMMLRRLEKKDKQQ